MRFVYKPRKAIAAIRFIADHNVPELTKGKVNKLLFLADKLHLVRFARPITGDWYAAMPHGPVPSETDNLMDAFEAQNFEHPGVEPLAREISLDRTYTYPRLAPSGPSLSPEAELSPSDKSVLSEIIDHFGSKSFSELRSITHEMPAYEKAWGSRTGNRGTIEFEDLFEEDENAVVGALEEAVENAKLRSVLSEPLWD